MAQLNRVETAKDEVEVQQEEHKRIVGKWFLGETLGKGGFSWVKKGYDRESNQPVALKFIDRKASKTDDWSEKQLRMVTTEIEALKKMKHPNIIRLLAYNFKTTYPDKDGKTREVILLVLEYMSGGELFDILYYTSKLDENIARTYFRQLIEGLEACHKVMIVHRDIKPQNLLLDKYFSLKISDFGLSKIIKEEGPSVSMNTFQVGTHGYQAPEILLRKPYSTSCDIFSAGVVLFILLVGYPPFEHATETDRWYGSVVAKQYRQFWAKHRGCGIGKAPMDLITRMIHFEPGKRIAIAQIKQHPWYSGEILEKERLHKVLHLRHMQMQAKRLNDGEKTQVLDGSEHRTRDPAINLNTSIHPKLQEYLKQSGKSLNEEAPPLPPGEHAGILDRFTEMNGYEVLNYFLMIIIENEGVLITDFDNFSIRAEMGLKRVVFETTQNVFVEINISVYRDKKLDCNVVKYHRLKGDILHFQSTLQFLQSNAWPVLTGLPKKHIPNHKDEDLSLLRKYFPETSNSASQDEPSPSKE